MRRLEARPEAVAARCAALSPVDRGALLTVVGGFDLFSALGKNPVEAFRVFFVKPVRRRSTASASCCSRRRRSCCARSGLAVGFRANVWNIGAEGQLIDGRDRRRRRRARASRAASSALVLPAMIVAGALGGMLWAAIPALLRTRFNANEILVSLMLVYVAQLAAVAARARRRGAIRKASTFRRSKMFADAALLPILVEGTRLNVGVPDRARGGGRGMGLHAQELRRIPDARRRRVAPRRPAMPASPRRARSGSGMLVGRRRRGARRRGRGRGPDRPAAADRCSPGYGFAAIIVAFVGPAASRSASCSRAC